MLIIRWPKKDRWRRSRYTTVELHKLVLRGLLASAAFPFEDRVFFFKRFQGYPSKVSLSSFRNSCLFTGHSRSVFRLFKLCRHSAKGSASSGYLMGLRKASF